ncbi:hypothetical protein LOC67_16925 [Stieleria sp. JC731]|uniref:hypothetical protein n=1 Tax=Stieleria sp. JC731 TaxID=2894195 RepID=UPI001E5A7AE9|nr:hypothetical protein [Stieleria sp. JC731]MCC9602241.1 hypothetical protein [Stieleria sp. JC731]
MEYFSIGQTLNINPPHGLGPIDFGALPSDVRGFFGTDLVWEEWMDGNMNDCLYYPGLVFHFDRCDSRAPLPSASLIAIEVFRRGDCVFRGRPMTHWSRPEICKRLGKESVEITNLVADAIAIPRWNLEVSFDSDGYCEHFWLDRDRIQYPS